jgi:hypothetical protein
MTSYILLFKFLARKVLFPSERLLLEKHVKKGHKMVCH